MGSRILKAFLLDICVLYVISTVRVGARVSRAVPDVPYPNGQRATEQRPTVGQETAIDWSDYRQAWASVVDSENGLDSHPLTNSIDFIWSKQTVAAGDTAVLHCSFDAIFSQLRNGNIDWVKESPSGKPDKATLLATGKKVVLEDRRYRVYRPHNSALSVLIIRRAKKKDGGIFKCNLSGSSTRHKYLILNVTESKIEAQTSPSKLKARIGKDVTLWCNATGYPRPVVYWTREDSNHKLPDGTYQFWGNGLRVMKLTDADTGIYACYLDNFVQPVVSYKFNLVVEDRPWHLDGYKMRFDSSQWYPHSSVEPRPVQGKSFLLMCETRGTPKPLPKIRWFKNTRELRNNRHFYIIEDKPEWRDGYTSSTLVIMKFVPRHQANYTCLASNHFRSKRIEFFVNGFERMANNGNVIQVSENSSPHVTRGRTTVGSLIDTEDEEDDAIVREEYMINPRKRDKGLGRLNTVDAIPKVVQDPLSALQEEDGDDDHADVTSGPPASTNVDSEVNGASADSREKSGSGNGGVGPNDDEDYDEGVGSGSGQEEDSEEEIE